MAKNIFESNIKGLIKTIESCFKDKELVSGLILYYSIVDIMAWLSRDPHDADATKSDFTRWVEEFLLPGSGLKCTSEELYAARCAIIHSYVPEWGPSTVNKSEPNRIYYVWGKPLKETPGDNKNNTSKKSERVVISVDDLVYALKVAIQRFEDSLSYNRSMSEIIAERSKKYFIEISKK
jgi:hypothetical protein